MPARVRGRVLLLPVLALALAAIAMSAALPTLAERWLLAELRARGFAAAKLRVAELRLGGARIEGVSIGAPVALEVKELALEWSPSELLAGRLARAHARGLLLRAGYETKSGLHLGALEPLLSGEGGWLPAAIEISGAHIELALGASTLSARGNLTLDSDGERIRRLQGGLTLSGAASGDLVGSWKAGGALSLSASLRAASEIETPLGAFVAPDLTLTLVVSRAPQDLAALVSAAAWESPEISKAELRFSARAARIDAGSARSISLSAGLAAPGGERAAVAGELAFETGDFSVQGNARFALARTQRVPERLELSVQLRSLSDRFPAASLAGELRVRSESSRLRIEAVAPLALELARQAARPGRALLEPFRSQLTALWLSHAPGSGVEAHAELAPARLALGKGGVAEVRGTTPAVVFALRSRAGSASLRWSAQRGALHLPGSSLRVDDLVASGSLELVALRDWRTLRIERARITHTAPDPTFSPFALHAEISGVDTALRARGELHEVGAKRGIPFAIEERSAASRLARFSLEAGPARFDAQTDLVAFLRPLRTVFDSVTGELAWRGEVELSPAGEIELTGGVRLDQAGIAVGALRVAGLRGELALDSLRSLRIAPSELSFERVSVGPGIESGGGTLEMTDGELRVTGLLGRSLGGEIAADLRASRSGEGAARVACEAISIDALARFLEVADFSGEGSLSGELELAFDAERAHIRAGSLRALAPGALKYLPAAPPAALEAAARESSVLLRALEDFRFDTLEAQLAPASDGVEAHIALDGRNPELQGGRPVELRARIVAPLDELLALSDAWQRLVRRISRSR
jgi:hypothetical protein